MNHFTLCFGIKSSSPWTFYNYLISKPEWHFIFLKFQWKLYWSHRVQWCVCCDLDPLQPCAKPTLTNLGVKLWFILDTQIKSIIKATFYHLRLLSKLKSTFKLWTFHLCFYTVPLDYCNVLCFDLWKDPLTVCPRCCSLSFNSQTRVHLSRPRLPSLAFCLFRDSFKDFFFLKA